MSVSGNDGAACSDEDCEDHDQRSDAGDDCWDMAEGDDEALVMTVMQKVSRYAVDASSPRALHFVLRQLRIVLLFVYVRLCLYKVCPEPEARQPSETPRACAGPRRRACTLPHLYVGQITCD